MSVRGPWVKEDPVRGDCVCLRACISQHLCVHVFVCGEGKKEGVE